MQAKIKKKRKKPRRKALLDTIREACVSLPVAPQEPVSRGRNADLPANFAAVGQKAASQYLAEYGHLVPSELTENGAAQVKMDFPKVLAEHPRMMRPLDRIVRGWNSRGRAARMTPATNSLLVGELGTVPNHRKSW